MQTDARKFPQVTLVIEMKGKTVDIINMFKYESVSLHAIRGLLCNVNQGSLVLCSSITGGGKSTTQHAFVEDAIAYTPGSSVIHEGPLERYYSNGVAVRIVERLDAQTAPCFVDELLSAPDFNQIVVFDELTTGVRAGAAVALAKAGYRVLATMHANSADVVHRRIRQLLEELQISKPYDDFLRLLFENRCFVVHQDRSFVKESEASLQVRAERKNPAIAAIEYALKADEGLPFLQCWLHGQFAEIRKEWPDCPDACFNGA